MTHAGPEPHSRRMDLAWEKPGRASRRHRRLLLLLALASLPIGASPPGCSPEIAITAPAADGVTLAPSVEVEVTLAQPLHPHATLEATLERGLDDPDGATVHDRSDDLVLARRGRRSATLVVPDLAPGRNRVIAMLRGTDGEIVASDARVIDRGGFHGASGGPFGAGVRERTLSRPATLEPGLRHLDVLVWYPSDDPSAEPASPREVELQAVLDAPGVPGAAALPTVVYSHGNCGWESQSSFLLADLARAGFLVVSPGHTGDTVEDPCCSDFLATSFPERLDDVRALLDVLPAWSAEPGGPFEGLLDPERIALVGYSAGGITAIPIGFEDARIAAVVTMGTPVSSPSVLPLPVPALLVAGSLDETAPPIWVRTFIYDNLVAPRFLATIVDAGHSSFQTFCPPTSTTCEPGTTGIDVLHARIQRIVRAFLGRYPVRDVRWEAQLTREEGTRLRSDR